MPVLAIGITLATVDVPSVSALSFTFIGDVYGYGFPLPWKYYPILGIPTCRTCPPIPPSYNWFLFTLDVYFYMAIEYAVLFVYVKYHADKRKRSNSSGTDGKAASHPLTVCQLSTVAEREGLTIKEDARRALLEWSLSGLNLKQDPLFRVKPVRFREKIRASEIDRFLYHAK